MLSAIQLLCAFLLGIGFIFALIDLRTHFGPQFRNFSVCLVALPAFALLDLLSFAEHVSLEAGLWLQRIMHLAVLPFIVFSASYLPRVAGRSRSRVDLFFAVAALVLAPITITDLFLTSAGGKVSGGPLYAWTFLPLGTSYILFAYWVLFPAASPWASLFSEASARTSSPTSSS